MSRRAWIQLTLVVCIGTAVGLTALQTASGHEADSRHHRRVVVMGDDDWEGEVDLSALERTLEQSLAGLEDLDVHLESLEDLQFEFHGLGFDVESVIEDALDGLHDRSDWHGSNDMDRDVSRLGRRMERMANRLQRDITRSLGHHGVVYDAPDAPRAPRAPRWGDAADETDALELEIRELKRQIRALESQLERLEGDR